MVPSFPSGLDGTSGWTTLSPSWDPLFHWAEVIFNPQFYKLKAEQEFPPAPPPKLEASGP